MNRKLRYDQYEVIVNFKTDNCLYITVQDTYTGELFVNNSVQLMRINRDTIIAALEKKNQGNIRCEFSQLFSDKKKRLNIVFIVNFDFLPEFREELMLQLVDRKQSINTFNMVNMGADVQELTRALESIKQNGNTIVQDSGANIMGLSSQKKQIFRKNIKRGKYIIRVSGMMNNTTSAGQADKFTFHLCSNQKKDLEQVGVRTHCMSSYYLPFSFSRVLDCEEGAFKIDACSGVANAVISNLIVVMNRVTQAN